MFSTRQDSTIGLAGDDGASPVAEFTTLPSPDLGSALSVQPDPRSLIRDINGAGFCSPAPHPTIPSHHPLHHKIYKLIIHLTLPSHPIKGDQNKFILIKNQNYILYIYKYFNIFYK